MDRIASICLTRFTWYASIYHEGWPLWYTLSRTGSLGRELRSLLSVPRAAMPMPMEVMGCKDVYLHLMRYLGFIFLSGPCFNVGCLPHCLAPASMLRESLPIGRKSPHPEEVYTSKESPPQESLPKRSKSTPPKESPPIRGIVRGNCQQTGEKNIKSESKLFGSLSRGS